MAMLDSIQGRSPVAALLQPASGTARPTRPPQVSFASMLESALHTKEPVRFSAHATERLASRGITLGADNHARLGEAVDQAAAKGARESLVLDGELAYVVNVPRRTVITAMPISQMTENVFTNIDSAVVVPQASSPADDLNLST
jgi:flagellar operon protein